MQEGKKEAERMRERERERGVRALVSGYVDTAGLLLLVLLGSSMGPLPLSLESRPHPYRVTGTFTTPAMRVPACAPMEGPSGRQPIPLPLWNDDWLVSWNGWV
jgi:hypothetical protein